MTILSYIVWLLSHSFWILHLTPFLYSRVLQFTPGQRLTAPPLPSRAQGHLVKSLQKLFVAFRVEMQASQQIIASPPLFDHSLLFLLTALQTCTLDSRPTNKSLLGSPHTPASILPLSQLVLIFGHSLSSVWNVFHC